MSAAAQKDLNYYLSHTDEMPTDPKEIERLANAHMEAALESGTEQMDVNKIVGTADETPGAAAANSEASADDTPPAKAEAAQAEPAQAAPADAKPEGVLAKDGKNIIPYSQLETARQRAAAAEALAREQATELATLRAAKAAPVMVEDVAMLSEEELEALEAAEPTLARVLRAQQADFRMLRDQVNTVTQSQAARQAEEEAEVKSEVQTAIDGNPVLATWQTSEDQTAWNEASRIDAMLRANPKYANVSFEDRFKKVVEMTQVALDLAPATDAGEQEPPAAPTQAQIKEAAAAKVARATKGKKPVSLSDIPGGAPPAVDERQKVEDMSTVALGQMFLGMSEEQRQAYLASL